jgi:oxalate decarboxylase/phosphoglucose isomerase-like protein (cupin superfamily)
MTSRVLLIGAAILMPMTLAGGAQAPQSAPGAKPLVDATHRRLQPEDALDGSDRVLIFGDPTKPGFYAYRNRFRPGVMTRPHYHDQDRWVTVIKGTWWTDEGDVYRPDKAVGMKAGGFMFHPKGLHHYDGAKDEEAIVQIMGMGPVQTVQTEVDANGKPVSGR